VPKAASVIGDKTHNKSSTKVNFHVPVNEMMLIQYELEGILPTSGMCLREKRGIGGASLGPWRPSRGECK